MLLCMAAILAIAWYCLFTVARGGPYIDGTFVNSIQTEEEMRLAA